VFSEGRAFRHFRPAADHAAKQARFCDSARRPGRAADGAACLRCGTLGCQAVGGRAMVAHGKART